MLERFGDRVRDGPRDRRRGRPTVVFHCAAGKDRTGLVAMLVLGLLGVADEIIAADYALDLRRPPDADRAQPHARRARGRPAEVHFDNYDEAVLTAEAVTMLSVLGRLRAEHSSVESYLLAHGLPTDAVAALRAGLLA